MLSLAMIIRPVPSRYAGDYIAFGGEVVGVVGKNLIVIDARIAARPEPGGWADRKQECRQYYS